MIRPILCWLLVISILGSIPHPANAQSAQYEAVREKYLRLRNTDREITRRAEWERVVSQLSEFADSYSSSREAPSALMHVAIMNEELYKRYKDEEYLDAAISSLTKLSEQYRTSDAADEALFKLGELYLNQKDDRDEAKEYFGKVIQGYPESDMAEAARIKLNSIDQDRSGEGKIKVPSDEKKNGRVVVLDPGHGGEDLGAVGVGGLYEKDVTLIVALETKRLLEERGDIVVRLTRVRDEFIPLMDRTSFANDFEAEIFVSLHVNASPSKQLSGLEVYYLDNTGDKASKTLAERENASIHYEGAQADVQYMLSDLIQNVKLEDSVRLAGIVKNSVISQVRAMRYDIKDLGVKKAPFYVLVGAHMPCVLVEMSFIDQSVEGAQLGKKEYRTALAKGISQGITTFLEMSK